MSKRKRPETGYRYRDDAQGYEDDWTKDAQCDSEGQAVPSSLRCAKDNPTMDNDAFLRSAAYCRELQREIERKANAKILPSVQQSIQKQQQRILWSLVQYVSRDAITLNEEIFCIVTQLANDLIFSSESRCKLEPKRRNEEEWIDGWMAAEENDKDSYCLESSVWSVHQLVYELVLKVLLSSGSLDARIVSTYWNASLLCKVVKLFNSPDAREKDYILSIIHIFYKTMIKFRRIIRKLICNRFQSIVFEKDESAEGIAEMLEFCHSIIRGFAVPLRKEHEEYLMHCLLPLHKFVDIESFYPPLLFCIMAYLEKDPRLAPRILNYLFRCWPISNSSKEVLFLNHLEEILAATPADILGTTIWKATHRIGKCMASFHSHVSHRAFLILENAQVWSLLLTFREKAFPILVNYVEQVISSHWNNTILQIASVWYERFKA